MKRKTTKTRCSGQWTEAQFTTFVKNQLRGATWKWKPISDVLKKARQTKGWYLCNCCKQVVPATVKINNKRIKNVFVDHILPVVDPEKGFTTWDEFIDRLYCEEDNLQVLCGQCHDEKTLKERKKSAERRKKDKNG